ncbi:MAG: FmdB family zinc ribbon protein [Solirubrobacteraceae bacterium]
MPFYEYRRPDGTTIEVMQKMSDPPLTEDPETGVPLQRVFHPIAVHFKGKGFYNTDYGTKNRQREQAAAEGAKSDSAKSDSGSGETKSADAAASSGEKKSSESTPAKTSGETTSAAKK